MSRYQSIMVRAFAEAGNRDRELVLLDLGSADVTLNQAENLPVLHYVDTYPRRGLRGYAKRLAETLRKGCQPTLLRPLFVKPRVSSIDAPAVNHHYNRWLAENGIGYVVYLQGAGWETVQTDIPFAVFIPAWFLLQPLGNDGLWLAFLLFLASRGIGMHIGYRRRVLPAL